MNYPVHYFLSEGQHSIMIKVIRSPAGTEDVFELPRHHQYPAGDRDRANKIMEMFKAFEEIDSQAIAAILARDSAELLTMMENIHKICERALKS